MTNIHCETAACFLSTSALTAVLSFAEVDNTPALIPFHSVLIFIITILLLAADFYYLKNIAGRRLVGLRWWNEVDPTSGDSKWVFESFEPGTKQVNATDSRFFWMALYVHPLVWAVFAVVALVRFKFIWLSLVGRSRSLRCSSF
jgi:hypothetical protein